MHSYQGIIDTENGNVVIPLFSTINYLVMRNLFISILTLCLLSACGSPRSVVKVKNMAEGVQTSVTTNVGAGGSTTVTVSPNAEVQLPYEN